MRRGHLGEAFGHVGKSYDFEVVLKGADGAAQFLTDTAAVAALQHIHAGWRPTEAHHA